ncbi:MAG: phage terminase large subunit [Selenomonadaceae bacterium]|nr:phage terminase large subunit [Selenomonadaceae bacterium]
MQRLRGRGAIVTQCEEAFEVSEEDFNRVDESLRGILPEGYYIQWLITFNPYSASSWLKARFFDTPSENVLAMTTTYKNNEWLSENDLALFKEIERTDPDRAKVVCEGMWGIESGQYFSMWRESLHVVKPFEIPRDWVKFRAMDFGTARPYAVLWFAIDYDGDAYVYRELYGWGGKPNVGTGETARQIGEKIVELEMREENLLYAVLDSACWARSGVTGPTIAEELNSVLIKKGLVGFMPSSKGRMEGANAFKQRLIGNELEDGNYKPAIKFFSTCIHCLRTIPIIGHDKHKPELPDTDAEDH